jgi:hypothetical protein
MVSGQGGTAAVRINRVASRCAVPFMISTQMQNEVQGKILHVPATAWLQDRAVPGAFVHGRIK